MRVGLVVKPRTRGSRASASMRPASAPSAKILMRRRCSDMEDPIGCRLEAAGNMIGCFRWRLIVSTVDEYGAAAGGAAGFDIARAVPHEKAVLERNTEMGGGAE